MSARRLRVVKSETTEARTPSVFDVYIHSPREAIGMVAAFVEAACAQGDVRLWALEGREVDRMLADGVLLFGVEPGLGDPEIELSFVTMREVALRYLGLEPCVTESGDLELIR